MRFIFMVALLLTVHSVPAPAQPAGDRVRVDQSSPRRILFVGNSFTQGAHSALRNWRRETVDDLNRTGLGGVPALFAAFARQCGLRFVVVQETVGGKSLAFHYAERRQVLDRAWDVVILQEYSTLDRERPGDVTNYKKGVEQLYRLFQERNSAVAVYLMATWSRADLVYASPGRWHGQPIDAMAKDLRAAAEAVSKRTTGLAGIIPVGEAWNRSFAAYVADPNPYDGIARGAVNLWAYDDYHGSLEGYYLEALVVFGKITGTDPRRLGRGEAAADELGIAPAVAAALQQVAYDQLEADRTRTSVR